MKPHFWILSVGIVLASSQALFLAADESASAAKEESRVTEAVARDRAKLLHQVYSATLEVMHERYFHGERAFVPARALEDVFDEVAKESRANARWISVNTKPMSVHHEPKSDFEKQAAAEIAKGAQHVERMEKGFYQRATAIALGADCVQCHTGFFADAPKSPRYAGLVIRIKLDEE